MNTEKKIDDRFSNEINMNILNVQWTGERLWHNLGNIWTLKQRLIYNSLCVKMCSRIFQHFNTFYVHFKHLSY